MSENLTLKNFKEKTGHRFRMNKDQATRVKAGTLTREQAFQEFLLTQNAQPANS